MYGTWAKEMMGTLRFGCTILLYATILTHTVPVRSYEPYIRFLMNCMVLLLLLRLFVEFCKGVGLL